MNKKSYDIVVCGAGVAGVAAAVAAARQGMKTALIEKQCLLGGLATSGLIYIYLPLCDGYGHQAVRGISEELIKRCIEYGPFDIPACWGGPEGGNPGIAGERYQCCFSPAGFVLTMDKMLEEVGVDLWLDTTIFDVCTENRSLKSVLLVNSSGHMQIDAKCFIDATGGAFVVQMAGGKVYREANYITPWFMEMSETPEYFHFSESLHVQCAGSLQPEFNYPECYSGQQVSQFVRETWGLIRERYDVLSKTARKKNYPVNLPAMPQIRKIARINAVTTLTDGDSGKHFGDSVGMVTDWRTPAPVWETPYGTLIPRDVRNTLAAGRCIGASGDAWEIFRVIPAAAMTGEAAGTAAALSVHCNCTPSELNISILQKELSSSGRIRC